MNGSPLGPVPDRFAPMLAEVALARDTLAGLRTRRYKTAATRQLRHPGAVPVPASMTNILILLGLTETVRKQYRDRLQERFPDVPMTLVDHHSKVGPHIADAEA